ncbi:hypothetical protein CFC21_049892 [Triticum aestivum]|uniref:NAC domain-containing protein n=2 Tax=Triticum aestivum TaxID=4565 RepID=A0A3B6H539_WHEAT|nr:hypothetical protein CFC21_049892 [Triticum aestivum]
MAPVAEIWGLTPGYKFMPADEEVIEFYLIPRLRGQPLPLDGVIIDEDPRSAPPWKLFERNGLDEVDVEHAFFFTSGEYAKSAKRKVRACAGGTWVGMKVGNKGKLRLGGETFAWQVYRMNYQWGAGRRTGSTGWVMLEYSIVAPADCASIKVCKISFSGYGQKRQRVPDGYVDDCHSGRAATRPLAAALPSSTTKCYSEPQDEDAGGEGEADSTWTYQEPFTAAQQFDDQDTQPLIDVGCLPGFSSTPPVPVSAVDDGMMQSQMFSYAVAEGEAEPTRNYEELYTETTTQQFDGQAMQPPADVGGFPSTSTASGMDDGTIMPLQIDQETHSPEKFVDYGTVPPLTNQEFCMPEKYVPIPPVIDHEAGPPQEQFFDVEDPELQVLLESFSDFATAGQNDPGFGDYFASAGQDYDLNHHVLPKNSFNQHQVF